MAALASYARQAEDETLLKHAMRIQGRAVRRAGDLLKEIDGRGGDRSKTVGADSFAPSQRAAAAAAGMSERQQVTAVRVASIPAEEFEAAIESVKPPTVTALAERGKKSRRQSSKPRTAAPKPQTDEEFAESFEPSRAISMIANLVWHGLLNPPPKIIAQLREAMPRASEIVAPETRVPRAWF
jgi:hypothetical protein